jgi:hypothetical protein
MAFSEKNFRRWLGNRTSKSVPKINTWLMKPFAISKKLGQNKKSLPQRAGFCEQRRGISTCRAIRQILQQILADYGD